MMSEHHSRTEEAERCVREADMHVAAGRAEDALDALHRAVLLYASADSDRENLDEAGPLTSARAHVCRRYAAALAATERHAEAANVYQEATDLFGLLDGGDSRRAAAECARSLLASVAALKAQPQERLHLLVARYERMQEQIAIEPGSEARQAECRMHIARIYQRRERPAEAIASYAAALDLLDRCEELPEIALVKAECHHRAATLLAASSEAGEDAARHYRSAIALYAPHEPFVYGHQQSMELCTAALARVEAAIAEESSRPYGP